MSLVDTHAHLDFTDDKEGWCEGAKTEGVNKIICVGTSVEASRKCVEISEEYSSDDLQIYATVGIHAQDGKSDVDKFGSLEKCTLQLKQTALSSEKVIGVGECGYDIRTTDNGQLTTNSEKEFQRELFEAQVGLAEELNLPMIIHCRNAWEETFDTLSGKFSLRSNNKMSGVFHSWTGDWEAAQTALDLGFHISFSGIVTFKNAPNVQEVARIMPLEKMLLETDSPYLSPHPLRGSKNEPKNVNITAQFIAQLRNLPVDRIASVTSQNAGRLFGI